MKRTWVIVVIAVLAGAAAYWVWQSQSGGDEVVIDLVEAFRKAEKRTSLPDPTIAFSMEPQTIKGETKPAIFAHAISRIIYHDIQVPENARLEVFLAVKEEAWDKGTDGVYFRVGVSRGDSYKDLTARLLDPYRNPQDRGWVPLAFDLSEYGGDTINVVFNTAHSAPGGPDNGLYDFGLFGAPRIVATPAP